MSLRKSVQKKTRLGPSWVNIFGVQLPFAADLVTFYQFRVSRSLWDPKSGLKFSDNLCFSLSMFFNFIRQPFLYKPIILYSNPFQKNNFYKGMLFSKQRTSSPQALRSNDPQSIEETLRVLDEEVNEWSIF